MPFTETITVYLENRKGKFHPISCPEGTDGKWMCRYTLFSTSTLEVDGKRNTKIFYF